MISIEKLTLAINYPHHQKLQKNAGNFFRTTQHSTRTGRKYFCESRYTSQKVKPSSHRSHNNLGIRKNCYCPYWLDYGTFHQLFLPYRFFYIKQNDSGAYFLFIRDNQGANWSITDLLESAAGSWVIARQRRENSLASVPFAMLMQKGGPCSLHSVSRLRISLEMSDNMSKIIIACDWWRF